MLNRQEFYDVSAKVNECRKLVEQTQIGLQAEAHNSSLMEEERVVI